MTVLLRGGNVYSPVEDATAMLTDGGLVAWVGRDVAAPPADQVIELDGALVAPAFVDAHVHATHTGLAIDGLDLSGAASLQDALDRLSAYAAGQPGSLILGTGWDETRWPERRAPSAAEIDRAARDRRTYLSRVDGHSAVASPALLADAPTAVGAVGYGSDGLVALEANHVVRRAAYAGIDAATRASAQRSARRRAAEVGIGAFHEMGGPEIAGEADFIALMQLAAEEAGPTVFGYWGEIGAVEQVRDLGAVAAGGDLFVDGSVGSHTALLSEPYADAETCGHRWLTTEQISEHVIACSQSRLQSGFHAIGDAAIDIVLAGFRAASDVVGLYALGKGRHRVEHAELTNDPSEFARYGLIASVQPAFDARWGGGDGMYVDRLGAERAEQMNPFAAFAAAGVPLLFGSDAPVTPLDPWGAVRAAVQHRTAAHAIEYRQAFAAHTVHGWRAVHVDDAGLLVPGSPATYAVWQTTALDSATGLPDLESPHPSCLRTVVRGRPIYERAGAFA